MPVQIPGRDREKIVDDDARRRLELESAAERSVYFLPAIERRQLFVRQIEDAHRLLVRERLVEAQNEGLPEVAADQQVAEPSPFDRLRSTSGTDVDEVVRRLDLPARNAEDSADRGAEVESRRRHSRFTAKI